MYQMHHCFKRMVALLTLPLLLTAWPAAAQTAAARAQGVMTVEVGELAVLPLFQGSDEARQREKRLEKNLDCQLQGLCATEQEHLFVEADATISDLVQAELRRRFADQVVPRARVRQAFDEVDKEPSETPRHIAIRVGRHLGIDHVMVGVVWRYRERQGSAMGASEPASVAFSLFLVEVADGRLVWQNSFDKTQTALSENLFDAPMFFKKGMKWLSAEELAGYGVEKSLKNLILQ
ncbi:MAG: hypothetical protein C0613_07585 [Desulfobulbaceae bacterium]|nr:MAG: hypothetical protein C0613_07585 [Desulfobulbaceae bacterium]